VWTLESLEKQRQVERKSAPSKKAGLFGLDSFSDPHGIGLEALKYSNEFRKRNGLPELQWHQSLAQIAVQHSKNMGDGKVPFGHAGFNERVRQYPFHAISAAENVAMNYGMSTVAKVAVDGWIDSPGHRKNLLANHNYCGIGVYQNSRGAWYLTQLFGRD